MKLRTSLWLDVLLISTSILYGGYLLATQDTPRDQAEPDRERHLLPGYVGSELTVLEFEGTHGAFSVRADPAQPGEYLLGGDVTGHADVALVRELSSTLEFATYKRRLSGASAVPNAVRDGAPKVSVRIVSAGRRFELRVYDATLTSASSADGEVYVSVHADEGDTWGVSSARILTSLLRSKQEFRGNQLFPFSMSQTLGLRIKDAQSQLELRGDEAGFLVEPQHKRADRALSDVLFFQLAQAKLTSFLAQSEAERLVHNDPAYKTIVQDGAGRSVTLLLGGSCPGDPSALVALRVTPPEIAGCATRALWAGLSLTADELLARTASTLNPDEIDHVIISGEKPSLDLMRKGADFVRLDAEQQPVPSAATDELLHVLTREKLALTIAPESAGPPSRTVTVVGQSRAKSLATQPWDLKGAPDGQVDATRQSIDVYDQEHLGILAHRLDDDTWLTVPPSLAWAFAQDDTWTKSRVLLDVPAEQITSLRVVLRDGSAPKSTISVARDGSSFSFTDVDNELGAADGRPDQSLCRGVFEGLSHLTAERYLSGRAPPERIWYEVHITRSAQDPMTKLVVGPRVRGGYQAWFSLAQAQFVLSEEMALRLSTSLFDRSPAQLDPDTYSAIKLMSSGREVVLKRVAGELYPESAGMSAQDVAPLLDALRGLNVLSYHPGREFTQPAEQTIDAQMAQDPTQHLHMEILGLHPYQDGVAYWARVRGRPGAFALAAAGVETLKRLL